MGWLGIVPAFLLQDFCPKIFIPRFFFQYQKSTPNERSTDQNKLTFLAEHYILRYLLITKWYDGFMMGQQTSGGITISSVSAILRLFLIHTCKHPRSANPSVITASVHQWQNWYFIIPFTWRKIWINLSPNAVLLNQVWNWSYVVKLFNMILHYYTIKFQNISFNIVLLASHWYLFGSLPLSLSE